MEELTVLHENPGLTAAEVAELLPGRTPSAVRTMRQQDRAGRNGYRGDLCALCGDRPVWRESAKAKEAHLCRGCWQDEEERRLDEARQANRIRQKRLKARREGLTGW